VTPEKKAAEDGENAAHGPSETAIQRGRCHLRILARPAHAA
jgi:hypothetical protein